MASRSPRQCAAECRRVLSTAIECLEFHLQDAERLHTEANQRVARGVTTVSTQTDPGDACRSCQKALAARTAALRALERELEAGRDSLQAQRVEMAARMESLQRREAALRGSPPPSSSSRETVARNPPRPPDPGSLPVGPGSTQDLTGPGVPNPRRQTLPVPQPPRTTPAFTPPTTTPKGKPTGLSERIGRTTATEERWGATDGPPKKRPRPDPAGGGGGILYRGGLLCGQQLGPVPMPVAKAAPIPLVRPEPRAPIVSPPSRTPLSTHAVDVTPPPAPAAATAASGSGDVTAAVIKTLVGALRSSSHSPEEARAVKPAAVRIEESLRKLYGSQGAKMREHLRRLVANLPHNHPLRSKVLRGVLSTDALLQLSSAQLAPEDQQVRRYVVQDRQLQAAVNNEPSIFASDANVSALRDARLQNTRGIKWAESSQAPSQTLSLDND